MTYQGFPIDNTINDYLYNIVDGLLVYNKILRTHSVDNISSFVKNRKITVKFIKT